jgi:hypothetical protein
MAVKKPLVMGANGKPQQLQSADSISVANAGTDLQNMTNGEASAIVIGAPVYIFSADTVKKAQANAAGTSDVFGLVFDVSITNATTGQIAKNGTVIATTGQWDAVTGQTGGLTPNTSYFLDPSTAGKMTTTAPTTVGQLVVLLGTAVSSTQFDVDVQTEILL